MVHSGGGVGFISYFIPIKIVASHPRGGILLLFLLILVASCLGSVVRLAWTLGDGNQTVVTLHDAFFQLAPKCSHRGGLPAEGDWPQAIQTLLSKCMSLIVPPHQ